MAAWSDWLSAAAVPSSGGDAPWSIAADLLPPSCSRLFEVVLRVNKPSPESGTADPDEDREGGDVWSRALASMAQDGSSPGLSFVDFPTAEGLLPIQVSSGGVAAARRLYVLVIVSVSGV